MQVFLEQVFPNQVPLIHTFLAQVSLIQALGTRLFKKKASKFVTLVKKTVTSNKNIISKKVPSF